MTLPDLLRRFHHLTLAAACVCLIVALQPILRPILPWLGPVLWPLALLVLLAGRAEGRWEVPAWLANALALLATGLCLTSALRNWEQLGARPLILVPFLGPLLLLLLVLRVYRPQSPQDLWMLQGMGLLQVALACTLAAEPLFGLLLLLYLGLALPLLALAQLDQARRRAGLGDTAVAAPRLAGRVAAWTVVVFLGGVALFLVTPRLSGQSWDPFQQLGVRPPGVPGRGTFSPVLDLNRAGTVRLGTEEAFRVEVIAPADAAGLPADVRWRTGVLNAYHDGVWHWEPITLPSRPPAVPELPDLGPGTVTLGFVVAGRAAGGLPLAEPILFGPPPRRRTVLFASGGMPFVESEGTLLLPQLLDGNRTYRQVTRPTATRWPLALPAGFDGPADYQALLQRLAESPLPPLADWSDDLLARLAAERRFGLRPEHLRRDGPSPVPTHAEPVARALADYLAASGDYTYTLDLRREDADLDPTLDFLWNVRQGHCERFASALAHLLRAQGIPSRVVRGFRGARPLDDGSYAVSQQDAHAWVEALVPREATEPGDRDGEIALDWIALDGTPAVDSPPAAGLSVWGLWEEVSAWQEKVWRELIVGYNAGQQSAVWQSGLLGWAVGLPVGFAAGLFGALGLAWLARRLGGFARRPTLTGPPWLVRLWAVLRRRGLLRPDPSRTPRELAAAARAALADHPAAADLADVPERLVALYYRARFGGVAASADELRRADDAVTALAARLG